jgi:hypothetical protein
LVLAQGSWERTSSKFATISKYALRICANLGIPSIVV